MMANVRSTALGFVLFLLCGGAVFAQDLAKDAGNYPTRPVMMIVPFAPGGASDFVARMIQQGVGEILGQQVAVDNRPGAAGMIGTDRRQAVRRDRQGACRSEDSGTHA